jgi:hypothetical protein
MDVHKILSCLYGTKALCEFTTDELKWFPVEFYINHCCTWELSEIYDKLPEDYQTPLKMHLPCTKHFTSGCNMTEFDGPPPPVKSCPFCIKEK